MNFILTEKAEKLRKALAENDNFIPEGHELQDFQAELGGSDGFWYNLTAGGYFNPADVIADKEQLDAVLKATELLTELEHLYDELAIEF